MIRYLPDTNVCVAYLRHKETPVKQRFSGVLPEQIVLCDVVKAELIYGAYRSDRSEQNFLLLETFFAPFPSLPFDSIAAAVYGRIRRELEEQGTPIGPYDLQIASIALANALILVTHNTKEFSLIPDLKLEDWENDLTSP